MVTTLNINLHELNMELLENLKRLFSDSKRLEIEIRSLSDTLYDTSETREEYMKRIKKAIESLENKINTVTFTEDSFLEFTTNLLK